MDQWRVRPPLQPCMSLDTQCVAVQPSACSIQVLSPWRWGVFHGRGQSAGWIVELARAAFGNLWQLFTIQNLATLVSTGIAIWKWWEAREANLFLRFERMISRYEHQLLMARSDLLDVMTRPGPGVLIRTPLFMTWKLRAVLQRRKWHPASLWPIGQALDRRLERADSNLQSEDFSTSWPAVLL